MNQVYFYQHELYPIARRESKRLNPFMNQVYFYDYPLTLNEAINIRLNPFMNQVYFYFDGELYTHEKRFES